jgi:hypothetical protein
VLCVFFCLVIFHRYDYFNRYLIHFYKNDLNLSLNNQIFNIYFHFLLFFGNIFQNYMFKFYILAWIFFDQICILIFNVWVIYSFSSNIRTLSLLVFLKILQIKTTILVVLRNTIFHIQISYSFLIVTFFYKNVLNKFIISFNYY